MLDSIDDQEKAVKYLNRVTFENKGDQEKIWEYFTVKFGAKPETVKVGANKNLIIEWFLGLQTTMKEVENALIEYRSRHKDEKDEIDSDSPENDNLSSIEEDDSLKTENFFRIKDALKSGSKKYFCNAPKSDGAVCKKTVKEEGGRCHLHME